MNVLQLIAGYKADLESARTELTGLVERGKNGAWTEAERQRSREIIANIEGIRADLASAESVQADDANYVTRSRQITPTNAARSGGRTATVRVGNEAKTYRSAAETTRNFDGTPAEPTFLSDLFRAQVLGDPASQQRLARHGQEMTVDSPQMVQRAVATGGVPGFIPPAYMDEYFAEYARAGRPVANLCRSMQLPPEGMSVNLPRVTTGTLTGVQTLENNALANQDPAATLLTVPVVTVGGYVILSRQSIERGNLTESVVVADMLADYNSKLDTQILNGTGANGQHLGILNVTGINAVTYTDASPTLGAMWPKLASAVGQIMSGRFAGPTAISLSPSEWAWMLAAKDTNGRPLIQPNQGAFNQLGTQDGRPTYQGATGPLFNLPVILDGNMPANLGTGTNETRIVVADFDDIMLFEDNGARPSQMRFEQPSGNTLGIMLVAYGYSALAAGRQPKAISVIAGTGLITPAL